MKASICTATAAILGSLFISVAISRAEELNYYSLNNENNLEASSDLSGVIGHLGEAESEEIVVEGDACSDCCDTCYWFGSGEPWKLQSCENPCGITYGGWFQFGYHNRQTPLSTARGDVLAFNDVPGSLNLHQSWLFLEKKAQSEDCCWDWGYRADIVYGTDAQKTQSFGGNGWDNNWDNGVYGWAMPQLYAEVAYGNLSVKGGHFYTLVGYEVVTAPDNFFYSHSLTMFNSEPFTHTGMLATYGVHEDLEVYAGWTAGWDTGFETNGTGSNFLGGFSYSVRENLAFTYITTAGDFGARGSNAYSHSLLLDWTICEDLNYVIQSDLVRVNSTGDDDVGINQYLIYQYNDCISFGGRFEWWKNEGASNYEVTGGVNIKPHANWIIRPELRHDWNPGTNLDQTTFGLDAIFTF